MVGQGTTFSLESWPLSNKQIQSCSRCVEQDSLFIYAQSAWRPDQNQPLSLSLSLLSPLSQTRISCKSSARVLVSSTPWLFKGRSSSTTPTVRIFFLPLTISLASLFALCSTIVLFRLSFRLFLQFSGVCWDIHLRFLSAF